MASPCRGHKWWPSHWPANSRVPITHKGPRSHPLSEVNGESQIRFWSLLKCAMNHAYDVCELKRWFSTSIKSQSLKIKFCVELHHLAQHTSPTTTWPQLRHRKGTEKDENHNNTAHIYNCSYVKVPLLVLRAANVQGRLCKVSVTGFGQR